MKIAVMIFSYLIGSILTGDIVARLKNVDLRNQGSGNVGATNVLRNMGSSYGALVLIGDSLKGVVAVLLGRWQGTFYGIDLAILCGLLVIIGHNWPIFARFHGGKGMATSFGVCILLTPLSLLVIIPVWLVIFILSGYVSLASIITAVAYPISVYLFYPKDLYLLLCIIIVAILAVYRHKANVMRLIKGEEHRILYQNKRSTSKK